MATMIETEVPTFVERQLPTVFERVYMETFVRVCVYGRRIGGASREGIGFLQVRLSSGGYPKPLDTRNMCIPTEKKIGTQDEKGRCDIHRRDESAAVLQPLHTTWILRILVEVV